MLDSSQLLLYDTIFLFGDFYISPFIFRKTVFQEKSCIPAMFLIHEQIFCETHQEMFKECVKCIPALKKTKCPLVTDKEQAIVDAVKKELPIFLWCIAGTTFFAAFDFGSGSMGHPAQT